MRRSPSARALWRGRGFTLPLLLSTALLLALACHGAIAMSTGAREPWRHRAADDGAAAAATDGVVAGAAVPDGDGLRFVADPAHPGALAHGAFLDARHTKSNFGKLRIVTGSVQDKRMRRAPSAAARGRPHSADRAEAFACGWLEGWLTAERIYDHFYNLDHYFKTQLNASMPRPMAWLKRNDAWVRQRVAHELQQSGGSDESSNNNNNNSSISNVQYWATVDLIVAQADGIAAGYATRSQEAARKAREAARAAAAAGQSGDGALAARAAARAAAAEAATVPPLTADDLLFLNGNGDLYDVIDMYGAIDAGELKPESEEDEDDDDSDGDDGKHRSSPSLDRWARRKFHLDDDDDAASNRTSSHPDPPSTAALRLARDLELSGKCSALVKVAADLSDVWLAHSTWDSFTAMTRIYKHLDWSSISESGGLAAAGGGGGGVGGGGRGKGGATTTGGLGLAAPLVSYSGYPGEVASDDDFYLASSGLFVTEATLHLFTAKALEPLRRARGAGVLSWVRVRAATALARDGEQWVEVLGREQSGTYNNAFLVADLKKFVPVGAGKREWEEGEEGEVAAAGDATTTTTTTTAKQPTKKLPGLYPGFLWLAEQLPGMLPSRDVTDLVALGYVAAYNVPLDEKVYRAAGYPAMVAEAARLSPADRTYGDPSRLMSYQTCPRAQLLRRDQARVSSLRDAQRLMRGNSYKSDELSEAFPVAAVCARGDLISRPGLAEPKGCYDTKVTSWSLAWGGRSPPLAAEVVGGPTLGGRLWRSGGGGGGVGGSGGTCDNVQADKEDPADPADGPLPPFRWDEIRHKEYAHRGMHQGPYTFRFERQQAQEDLPLPGDDDEAAAAVSR
jgi:hypothetical protein